MLDLDRIGGTIGWQRAAGLAAAYNREVSSHLFPEVSAHLLAATPCATGSNMSTGLTRFCSSRFGSRTALQFLPTDPAMG